MKLVSVHLTEAQLRTLKRDKCHVKRVGPYLYQVRNRRGKVYMVKLTVAEGGFGYECIDESGVLCQSRNFGNICRHSISAVLLCNARNEDRKRMSVATQEAAA